MKPTISNKKTTLAMTIKLFLDLVITPTDLVSLAAGKGGGH